MIIITKFIFFFYLKENFNDTLISSAIYAIFWGYKFDFALASILSIIITFLDFNKKSFIFIASIVIPFTFLAQISDVMYFYDANRHMGYEISDAITDASGLIMTAVSQHSILSIFSIIISFLLFLIVIKLLKNNIEKISVTKYYLLQKFILLILTVFFIRGMFQGIPLNPWQSNQIGDSKIASISLNGTYNGIYALANKSKKLKPLKLPTVSNEDITRSFKELYNDEITNTEAKLNRPNIVFFFLESWSAVNLKSYGYEKSTTPFFDEILKKSIRPKAMIAGGHRTTEGIFSTLSSFQNPLGRSIAKTQLQDNSYVSIIDILVKDGYKSTFFQGSSKETSGTGSFAQKLGFQYSYGKKEIKTRIYKENYWGIQDPDLYNFTLKTIKKYKTPFVIGINGATTHDDKIPSTIKKQKFSNNEKINNRLNALNFSDLALKNFMTEIEKNYPNTLFVLFADHCAGVSGSSFENYMIPFALYHKDLKPLYKDKFISQRDIFPTLLDVLYGTNNKYKQDISGKSLISSNNFFADYYHNGILGWIENDNILEINIVTNQKSCYKIDNFKDIKIDCNPNILSFEKRALSFSNISQKLLFDGDVKKFKEYRNGK